MEKYIQKIRFKYMEPCVQMSCGRFAKGGFIQYCIIYKQFNVNSLKVFIKYFLHLSTERDEKAQEQDSRISFDVEDLEAEKRPSNLILSCVYGEKWRYMCEKVLVTPQLECHWERYRTVLRILYNNSNMEALYVVRTSHIYLSWNRQKDSFWGVFCISCC